MGWEPYLEATSWGVYEVALAARASALASAWMSSARFSGNASTLMDPSLGEGGELVGCGVASTKAPRGWGFSHVNLVVLVLVFGLGLVLVMVLALKESDDGVVVMGFEKEQKDATTIDDATVVAMSTCFLAPPLWWWCCEKPNPKPLLDYGNEWPILKKFGYGNGRIWTTLIIQNLARKQNRGVWIKMLWHVKMLDFRDGTMVGKVGNICDF